METPENLNAEKHTHEELNSEYVSFYNKTKFAFNLCFLFRSTNSTGKRTDYIDWHEYFMALAFLAAKRSKDPATQVGACIVNSEKRVVGVGYNGMPFGCHDDQFSWAKSQGENRNSLNTKYLFGKYLKLKLNIPYTKLFNTCSLSC